LATALMMMMMMVDCADVKLHHSERIIFKSV